MWSRVVSAFALMSVGVTACDAETIVAVGAAGGVYRPDQGCTLVEGAPRCPGPGETLPDLRFETLTNPGITADASRGTLSDVAVTCQRSYCGTGSLAAQAQLEWTTDPSYPRRFAILRYAFNTPRDLMGRTVSFAIYVDDVTVPMHAQVGVIFDYWRWVAWAPLHRGWNRISGVVSAANPLTKIDPGVTSIPVTALQIDVYVPINTPAGDRGTWSGNIYVDDIAWQ